MCYVVHEFETGKKKFAACHLRMSRYNISEQHKVKANAWSVTTHQHVVGYLTSFVSVLQTLQPVVSDATAVHPVLEAHDQQCMSE